MIEVYTQAAFGIRHHPNGTYHRVSGQQYIQDLHQHIGRHMVLLADQDLAWTFSQMSTADIFVHSKSTLSIAAGILNTQVGRTAVEALVWRLDACSDYGWPVKGQQGLTRHASCWACYVMNVC